jgi:hypothetical protein
LLQQNGALTPIQCRAQFGEQCKAVAQPRELAWTGTPECDARGDALDVGESAQGFVDIAEGFGQAGDDFVAMPEDLAIAQRVVQPVAEQPAAHAGRAFVQQRKEGGRRVAP